MNQEKLEQRLIRKEKVDLKKRKEKNKQDKYVDLPEHILNKLYK